MSTKLVRFTVTSPDILQAYAKKTVLDPGEVKLELRMLQLVCRQEHPNIIKLHDFWETEHEMDIIMELCTGDLFKLLRSSEFQPLPRRLMWEILYQILNGLNHLHSIGICHRDLKPENGAIGYGQILTR